MRAWVRVTTLAAVIASVPVSASAIGEIFKVETSGTEYCGHFDNRRFSARNNVDVFVRIVADGHWDLSFSPFFEAPFQLFGVTYVVKNRKLVFSGAQFFDDGAYISLLGTATLDAEGFVRRASGTFMQDSLVFLGCISSGKWKTTDRLN